MSSSVSHHSKFKSLMSTCWFKNILSAARLHNPDYSLRFDETEAYEYFLMTHCRGQFWGIHRLKGDIYFFYTPLTGLTFPELAPSENRMSKLQFDTGKIRISTMSVLSSTVPYVETTLDSGNSQVTRLFPDYKAIPRFRWFLIPFTLTSTSTEGTQIKLQSPDS